MTLQPTPRSRDAYSERLLELIQAARQAPEHSAAQQEIATAILDDVELRSELHHHAISGECDRQQSITARHDFMWLMQQTLLTNKKLRWIESKYRNSKKKFEFSDAEQRTWLWFHRKFEEYDPTWLSPIDRFNWKMGMIAKDIYKEIGSQVRKEEKLRAENYEKITHKSKPTYKEIVSEADIDFNWIMEQESIEQIQAWLSSKKCFLEGKSHRSHPQLNCFSLITAILSHMEIDKLRFIPKEIPWEHIAGELQIEREVVERFGNKRCLPLLKEQKRIWNTENNQ